MANGEAPGSESELMSLSMRPGQKDTRHD